MLTFGEQNLFVDLGAEAPVAAEKQGRKIAVEIKSFLSLSAVTDLERAIGKYTLYGFLMARQDPDRTIFLAITADVYEEVFEVKGARDLIPGMGLRIMVFDLKTESVVKWIE